MSRFPGMVTQSFTFDNLSRMREVLLKRLPDPFSSSIDVVQPVKADEPEMVEEEEAALNEIVTEQSPED